MYLPIKPIANTYSNSDDNNSIITPRIFAKIIATSSIDLPNENDYTYDMTLDISKDIPIYSKYIINGSYNTINLISGLVLNAYPILINKEFIFKLSNSASSCTINSSNGELIDGRNSILIPLKNSALKLAWNGISWDIQTMLGGQNSGGVVNSVNGVLPDDFGNVQLDLDHMAQDGQSITFNSNLVTTGRISVMRNI